MGSVAGFSFWQTIVLPRGPRKNIFGGHVLTERSPCCCVLLLEGSRDPAFEQRHARAGSSFVTAGHCGSQNLWRASVRPNHCELSEEESQW
jgi:hypothetical protein